jgi:hypothetical protein
MCSTLPVPEFPETQHGGAKAYDKLYHPSIHGCVAHQPSVEKALTALVI